MTVQRQHTDPGAQHTDFRPRTVDSKERRQRPAWSLVLGRIGRRLGSAIFVVWAAATITFLIQALLPGDRATLLLNQQTGQVQERTPEELAPINEMFGFDQPIIV